MRRPELSWRVVDWATAMREAGRPTSASVAALFGRGAGQWRAADAINPTRAARLFAGRHIVRDLVTGSRAAQLTGARWAGFEPTPPGGKPVLADSETDFSIAHSGKWLLAVIVAGGRVGADLEAHQFAFDHPGLIRRMCTAAERETARSFEPARRRAWLAQLWTAKEAVAKLNGRGLRQDFRLLELGDRITVTGASDAIAASIAISETADPWQFTVRQLDLRQEKTIGVAR